MSRFYYTQTVTYTLQVEADTAEAADKIANMTDVMAAGISATSTGWEEDGYAE